MELSRIMEREKKEKEKRDVSARASFWYPSYAGSLVIRGILRN
jgi:hypothetical protein